MNKIVKGLGFSWVVPCDSLFLGAQCGIAQQNMSRDRLIITHTHASIFRQCMAFKLYFKNYTLKPDRWWHNDKSLDQEVCFFCSLRFELCGCSYDGHWRLTWSLTSGPVGLVEVHASWPEHLYLKKKTWLTRIKYRSRCAIIYLKTPSFSN